MRNEQVNIQFMQKALDCAQQAYEKGEVPVGAVITYQGKIISMAHNEREFLKNSCAHAEVLAIQRACERLKRWRLNDCEMYVTLEPCPMCAGALIQSRISKVCIATMDPKSGACGSVLNLLENQAWNHRVEVDYGPLQEPSSALLKKFFQELRRQRKEKNL